MALQPTSYLITSLVIMFQSNRVVESAVMHRYDMKPSGDTTSTSLLMPCGIRCNKDEDCQGFVIQSELDDPCILLYKDTNMVITRASYKLTKGTYEQHKKGQTQDFGKEGDQVFVKE